MKLKMTKALIKEYQKSLDPAEKYHFEGACHKALCFINKYDQYFTNKSILDYACGMGYTSYVFSLYCSSVDSFDANPNCEFVFRFNNKESNKLRWQDFDQITHNHYDTVFIYSLHNALKNPIQWFEWFVNKVSFNTFIYGDAEKTSTWATAEDKKRRIVEGKSNNYDYSLDGFSTISIDEVIPKVPNLRVIERDDTMQFSHQPNSTHDPFKMLVNEPKKIVYICEKIK